MTLTEAMEKCIKNNRLTGVVRHLCGMVGVPQSSGAFLWLEPNPNSTALILSRNIEWDDLLRNDYTIEKVPDGVKKELDR